MKKATVYIFKNGELSEWKVFEGNSFGVSIEGETMVLKGTIGDVFIGSVKVFTITIEASK
jgi:hypothetical protein